MSEWLRYCAAALAVAIFGFMLRSLGWSGAKIFSAIGAASIIMMGVTVMGTLTERLGWVFAQKGLGGVMESVLKIVGVGYVFGICSDMCSELGEGGVASALTVVGRGSILLAVMPTLFEIIEVVGG